MSNLGHSGASIEIKEHMVVKRGGTTDLFAQAYLMHVMGWDVCPVVFNIGNGAYIMERLQELNMQEEDFPVLFLRTYQLLAANVWSKPAQFHDQFWWQNCKDVHQASWIKDDMVAEAHVNCTYPFVLVHGDPTIANLMRRADGELLIIDPVPCRKGIPSMRCVDVGKMLQSAAGWENALIPGFQKPPENTVDILLSYEARENRASCLLWAAINCARVVVRAKRDDIKAWGTNTSHMFMERMQDALRV